MANRYISRTGTGDGSALASSAAWTTLDAQIAAAGPDGEVRLINDGTAWIGVSRVDVGSGGTSGHPVTVRGVAPDGSTRSLPVLTGTRTSPWPNNPRSVTPAVVEGGGVVRFVPGAQYLNFRDFECRNFGISFVGAEGTQPSPNIYPGITFGHQDLIDTVTPPLIAAFKATYPWAQRASAAAVAAASDIKDAALAWKAALSPSDLDRLENGIIFRNVLRGFSGGASTTTHTRYPGFKFVGGKVIGTARGGLRIHGSSGWSDVLIQDIFVDAEKQMDANLSGSNGSFSIGVECSGYARNILRLRCTSNNNWNGDIDGGYTNGDGFTGERGNVNLSDVCLVGHGNHDGFLDSKAVDHIIINPVGSGSRRMLRFWGQNDAYDVDLKDPATDRAYYNGMVYAAYTDMARIHSGKVEFTAAYNVGGSTAPGSADKNVFVADTEAMLGVSTAVQIINKPSYVRTFLASGTSIGQFFNPAATANPTFTSNATINLQEGTSLTFYPTVTGGPARFYPEGGADVSKFTFTYGRAISLPAKFLSNPQDANGDSVYLLTQRAYTFQGGTATQNVTVTITAAPGIATPDIIGRINASSGNAAIPPVLAAAYTAAAQALNDAGLYQKLDSLLIMGHSFSSGRISWQAANQPNNLTQDGSRPLPVHIPGRGFQAAPGRWGYNDSGETKFTPAYHSQFVWVQPTTGSGDIWGKPSNAISVSGGNAIIRANTGTTITVNDAFEGEGFVGYTRSEDDVTVYKDGAPVTTQTVVGGTTIPVGRRRFGTRTDGNTTSPSPIIATGWGYALDDTDWDNLYNIIKDVKEAIEDYFNALPVIALTAPQIVGIFAVGETLTVVPGTYNRNPTSYQYRHMVEGVSRGTGTTFLIPSDAANKPYYLEEKAVDAQGTSLTNNSDTITITVPPPSFYLSTAALGTADAALPEDAALYTAINSQGDAHPAAIMRLRADQGSYNRAGGALVVTTDDVIIDSYHPTDPNARALFTGGRTDPYVPQSNNGQPAILLGSGAGNLTLRRLDFADVGNGCIALNSSGVVVNGLQVRDIDATNVYRFLELSDTLPHSNILVEDVTCVGIERSFIRAGAGAHHITLRRCIADSALVNDEGFPSLFAFRSSHDVLIEDCVGKNVYWDGTNVPGNTATYFNGDAFETDDDCYNFVIRRCLAENVTDGGFDTKGTLQPGSTSGYAIIQEDNFSRFNKRNYRMFRGPFLLVRCKSETPKHHGGIGDAVHFGFYADGTIADLIDPIVTDAGDQGYYKTIFKIDYPNCHITVTGTGSIEVKPGQVLVINLHPESSTITFDPPVPGHDQFGNPLDGEPPSFRQFGPYTFRVTDNEGQVAERSEGAWSPIVFKAET